MLSIIENVAFTFSARGAWRANRGRLGKIVISPRASDYFKIIYCASANRALRKAHSICRILTAYAERVNARDYNFESEIKYRAQRENRRPAAKPRARGFSLNIKQISASLLRRFARRGNTMDLTQSGDKMRIIQELVPGKQITIAHVIANPDKILYKKRIW